MKSESSFHPVRHAAAFTLMGVAVFAASAAIASLVTRNSVLLECITAFGPAVFFIGYRTRFRLPEGIAPSPVVPRFLLWPCPFLFLLARVYGTHLPQWPDLATSSSVILTFLLVGLAEELTFRGVIFQAFHRLAPAWYVIISSTIFGLLHYEQGISGIGTTLIVGLAFGLARVAGVPLYALILCHAVIDIPRALSASATHAYPAMFWGALIYTDVVGLLFLLRPKHWSLPFLTLEARSTV